MKVDVSKFLLLWISFYQEAESVSRSTEGSFGAHIYISTLARLLQHSHDYQAEGF